MLRLGNRCRWMGSLVLLGLIALLGLVDRPVHAAAPKQPATSPALLSADVLAARIDALITAQQQKQHVQAAPLSDDAEFIRRVYLDLAGCIPSVVDVRDFLDDRRPDKRQIWIDELLQGQKPTSKPDAYARHFACVWRSWLLAFSSEEKVRNCGPDMQAWLYQQLQANVHYDQMVSKLITGQTKRSSSQGGSTNSTSFVEANSNLPENLASSTARLFLGVQMDCARCHNDRSGGTWTQEQFWSYAACFVEGDTSAMFAIPDKNKTVSACFPDDTSMTLPQGGTPRQALVQWLTRAENPYFARAAVNRLWSYFFGIGIIDPIDAGGAHNPPSHPELLDLLTRQFALHQFDLKYLIRAITLTRTYQLTSFTEGKATTPRLFSHMVVRGLNAEQLFDSLAEATEFRDPLGAPALSSTLKAIQEPRKEFLERFAEQGKSTETETSILQALYLMNSHFIADRTSLGRNAALASIADSVDHGIGRQVQTLYLVVLSRKPRPEESGPMVRYVERRGRPEERRRALADIFWVLLNSAEFGHNH